MRLLDVERLEIREFQDDKIPSYAILSHTWGDDEVSFEDMQGDRAVKKAGMSKIRRCSERAAADGYKYFWVDTCCIDKRSSAELSEAINSMYRWYRNAGVCYAYLTDVESLDDEGLSFQKSRWFTRGWTLQELLAPRRMVFCASDWHSLGTKLGLQDIISRATGIHKDVIDGRTSTQNVSIAQRMSWASGRQTTRVEDIAYSLMGIFDVNMPLLYGEGERAFMRLQEAIMKDSDDHSLFAWSIDGTGAEKFKIEAPSGLLASSPADFTNSRRYVRCQSSKPTAPYSITNKGLRIELLLSPNKVSNTSLEAWRSPESRILAPDFLAVLDCEVETFPLSRLAIHLTKISVSEDQYARIRPWLVEEHSPGTTPSGTLTTIYVKQRPNLPSTLQRWGIIIPEVRADQHGFETVELYSKGTWDLQARILWSLPEDFYGKLGIFKYGSRGDHELTSEFVVVVGMEPPFQVWRHVELHNGRPLKECFHCFQNITNLSSVAKKVVRFPGGRREATAEIKPFKRHDGTDLFVLNVSIAVYNT